MPITKILKKNIDYVSNTKKKFQEITNSIIIIFFIDYLMKYIFILFIKLRDKT